MTGDKQTLTDEGINLFILQLDLLDYREIKKHRIT